MKKLKSFGQHFLLDQSIAEDIVNSLQISENQEVTVIEIGPGEGVLTRFLVQKKINLYLIEIDKRLPETLIARFPQLAGKIINADVLKIDWATFPSKHLSIIGNFPYNISTQILFKIIEHKDKVWQMVGMFQKEVAKRVASKHGNKVYGVTSVLIQAYYDVTYLFEVAPHHFSPPPKVNSAVIRLERHHRYEGFLSKKNLFKIVKQAFSQRRKKLKNTLKGLPLDQAKLPADLYDKRAEQLSVEEFVHLSNCLLY